MLESQILCHLSTRHRIQLGVQASLHTHHVRRSNIRQSQKAHCYHDDGGDIQIQYKDECANLVHGLPESHPDNLNYTQHGDFAPKAYETMSGSFRSHGANAC